MLRDGKRLTDLLARERERFGETHPASARAHAEGREHLFGGVPMTWMNKAAGRFPLYLERARGSRVTDIDGHEYVDFSLGDTGAMAGHSPPEVVAAIRRRIEELGGITAMMPPRARPGWAPSWRGASALRSGPSRSRPPTPTAGPSGWLARSPAGRRSWSSPGATTAAWTRRSRSLARTARRW